MLELIRQRIQEHPSLLSNLKKVNKDNLVPSGVDVLKAFALTPLDKVKVIILGQDPYINGEAHGLSFSSQLDKIPPSLRIIYKELKETTGVERKSPRLEDWAEQGVLLLNTILTAERKRTLAHESFGWQDITKWALAHLVAQNRPMVAMLWGRYAQTYWNQAVPVNTHVLVLNAPHPAAALYGGKTTFLGCNHFNLCNVWLKEKNLDLINW